MKKNLLKLLLLMACLFSGFSASAYDFESDGIYYNISSETTVEVCNNGNNSYSGIVVIPKTVLYEETNYFVTAIGMSAFFYCADLSCIEIPNSVISIGDYSIFGCTSLTSVEIPNSVTSIGIMAFSACTDLTSVTIPNSVTFIGMGAFSECSGLTIVTLGNSVETIEDYAFGNCIGLEKIYNCSNTPQKMPENVFENVNMITCTLYVPTGCTAAYRAAEVWKDFTNIQEFNSFGVSDASGNEIQIAAFDNTITVKGAEEHAKVEVYGVNGGLIYSGVAKSIAVPTHGIFLVRVAGVTKKVAL